ncbi:hypothetical protein P168DRAFT_61821 [Aspergillus campestris IBT 28561]|uniref:Uncharacterized protein n=1 Tax=Aspergillus campestris (strain IBT 28561) TaxID=1392248 RepID=A0A2I1CUM0_ASPC2|nr:uncharacterized protein P168DRAFT_61821 [Aspergillus campestris IBT 28561]PKY01307.1 hypothetical protein P168DRAFT_61821 [Aspergillus campestris IBT 28561]
MVRFRRFFTRSASNLPPSVPPMSRARLRTGGEVDSKVSLCPGGFDPLGKFNPVSHTILASKGLPADSGLSGYSWRTLPPGESFGGSLGSSHIHWRLNVVILHLHFLQVCICGKE